MFFLLKLRYNLLNAVIRTRLAINTHTYKCIECNYSISRHSKSIDMEEKCCGHCFGRFELFENKKEKDGVLKSVPVKPKRASNAYALFVQANYATFKKTQLNHAQVLKILEKHFR